VRTKPRVTLLCPTYARPQFVEQTIKLFLRQTWTESELLIFDDSPRELRAAVPKTPRVKVIYLNERVPMGDKLNMGLDVAQGDFIAHWDDDDWQSPFRLTRQLETLMLSPVDICGYPRGALMTTGDARFWVFDPRYIAHKPLIGNATVPLGIPFMDGTAMFRRSIVGSVRYPTLPVGQKVVFIYELWKTHGARIKPLVNDGMYVYVRHHAASHAVNTWQYLQDLRLLEIPRPSWFPLADLPFYRKVG
jgi:glycosyltransferase involved in cell wall biosynthesis